MYDYSIHLPIPTSLKLFERFFIPPDYGGSESVHQERSLFDNIVLLLCIECVEELEGGW